MESSFQNCLNTFKKDIDNFKSEIEKYPFVLSEPIHFKLDDDLNKKFEHINPKSSGLYLFEINLGEMYTDIYSMNKKLVQFANDWELIKDSTRIIKKRLDEQLKKENSSEWVYFYLGKNKDLKQRILQHINLRKESSTHALKLRQRANLKNVSFRVSILEIESEDYYDFIVPYIERTLRKKYNPIIGKQ